MAVKTLDGEVKGRYTGDSFSAEEEAAIQAELQEAWKAAWQHAVESRGRSIPEVGEPLGVILSG